MTQSRRRALWMLGIWGAAAAGFVASFLADGGPAGYARDSGRILAGAACLAFGYAAFGFMMWRTRDRGGADRVVWDERDERIDGRSSAAALVAVMAYVFVCCLLLWLRYQEQGAVPAGWAWFLAYSTVMAGYLARAVCGLALDLGMVGRGQG